MYKEMRWSLLVLFTVLQILSHPIHFCTLHFAHCTLPDFLLTAHCHSRCTPLQALSKQTQLITSTPPSPPLPLPSLQTTNSTTAKMHSTTSASERTITIRTQPGTNEPLKKSASINHQGVCLSVESMLTMLKAGYPRLRRDSGSRRGCALHQAADHFDL